MVEQPVNSQKYGNDALFESPFDTYLFIPPGEFLADVSYSMNLTPNGLTVLSTVFELMAVFFLMFDHTYVATINYIIGYIFDCADGKMARKYKMATDLGCVLDFNTDMIVHTMLFSVLFWKHLLTMNVTIMVSFVSMIYLCNYYYGLVQAYLFKLKYDTDNFYEEYCKKYSAKQNWFYNLFLHIHKGVYNTYHWTMPVYNQRALLTIMSVLKYFGPGTCVIYLSSLMVMDCFNDYNLDGFLVSSLTSLGTLAYMFVGLVSFVVGWFCYRLNGRNDQYRANHTVHYCGLVLGLGVLVYAYMYSSWLLLFGGGSLFMFHLAYEMENMMTLKLFFRQ